MSKMHSCLKTLWFAVLSLGSGLGCTVDESGGSGGGKPCPDVTISSSSVSSSSTGLSAPFTPPSTGAGVGDGWLEYPDCPPGIAWLKGWEYGQLSSPDVPEMAEMKITVTNVDFDPLAYVRFDSKTDDFLLLSWVTRLTKSPDVSYYVKANSGEVVQVTGGWRGFGQKQILPVEHGSSVTFSLDPLTGSPELFYFHFYVYPGYEYVGCMRP